MASQGTFYQTRYILVNKPNSNQIKSSLFCDISGSAFRKRSYSIGRRPGGRHPSFIPRPRGWQRNVWPSFHTQGPAMEPQAMLHSLTVFNLPVTAFLRPGPSVTSPARLPVVPQLTVPVINPFISHSLDQ